MSASKHYTRVSKLPTLALVCLLFLLFNNTVIPNADARQKASICKHVPDVGWIYRLLNKEDRPIVVVRATTEGLAYSHYQFRRLSERVSDSTLPTGTIRYEIIERKTYKNVVPPSRKETISCVRQSMRDILMKSGTYEQLSVSAPTPNDDGYFVNITHRSLDIAPQDVVGAQRRLNAYISKKKADAIYAACISNMTDPSFAFEISSSAKVTITNDRIAFTSPNIKATSIVKNSLSPICKIKGDNDRWLPMNNCPRSIIKANNISHLSSSYYISSEVLWESLKRRSVQSVPPINVRLCFYTSEKGEEAYFEICDQYVEHGSGESADHCYWK